MSPAPGPAAPAASPPAPCGPLPEPARYVPLGAGPYRLEAGLHRFGTDFGNGPADRRMIQIDREWRRYRAQKLVARRERLDKYVLEDRPRPALVAALTDLLLDRLCTEHPDCFRLHRDRGADLRLDCRLSGERLRLDRGGRLLGVEPPGGRRRHGPRPPYASAVDALLCQIQEDLALCQLEADGSNRMSLLHLCAPNHWGAGDKIGRDFTAVHGPVPGFDRLARQARALVDTLSRKGPFVRFSWGLATDRRLNHHPEPPAGADPGRWQGRRFEPGTGRLWLRVERQVTVPFAGAGGFAFLIRTGFVDVAGLGAGERQRLHRQVGSMKPETLAYKGIDRDRLLRWLESGIP